jgi:hypothetical protein
MAGAVTVTVVVVGRGRGVGSGQREGTMQTQRTVQEGDVDVVEGRVNRIVWRSWALMMAGVVSLHSDTL